MSFPDTKTGTAMACFDCGKKILFLRFSCETELIIGLFADRFLNWFGLADTDLL